MVRKVGGSKKVTAKKPVAAVQKKAVVVARPAPVQVVQQAAPVAPAVDVQPLVEQLRRGDLASRSQAATKLAALGDPQAVSALREALRDPTAEVAREAAVALGVLKDKSAVHALVDVVLNRDGYYHSLVRAAAAESLGLIQDGVAVEALIAAVRDPVLEPSLAAIHALGRIADARAKPALEAVAANSDGFFLPQTQQAAAGVLPTLAG